MLSVSRFQHVAYCSFCHAGELVCNSMQQLRQRCCAGVERTSAAEGRKNYPQQIWISNAQDVKKPCTSVWANALARAALQDTSAELTEQFAAQTAQQAAAKDK